MFFTYKPYNVIHHLVGVCVSVRCHDIFENIFNVTMATTITTPTKTCSEREAKITTSWLRLGWGEEKEITLKTNCRQPTKWAAMRRKKSTIDWNSDENKNKMKERKMENQMRKQKHSDRMIPIFTTTANQKPVQLNNKKISLCHYLKRLTNSMRIEIVGFVLCAK